MSIIGEKLPQLCMDRNLKDIPDTSLEGYHLRSYKPGDEVHWDKIIRESFGMDDISFDAHMRNDSEYRPERVIFLCCDDIPVATASGWFKDEHGLDTGYLHMVGVLKDHGGKGLGAIVSYGALSAMKDEGRTRVVLNTDDFRIPAIKTYLKMDFRPVMTHESHARRWAHIFNRVGRVVD